MAARPDRTPLLQMLEMQALVITGSLDTTIAPAESVAMNAELRRSQLVELPLAGHLTNAEASEGFNAAVRRFLDRLS
jgi:pimeloyl-ACP methyl ester carboxylesterase